MSKPTIRLKGKLSNEARCGMKMKTLTTFIAAAMLSSVPVHVATQDSLSVKKSEQPGAIGQAWNLTIASAEGSVTINNVVANRGNCKNFDEVVFHKGQKAITLKFGQSAYYHYPSCNPI